MIEVVDWDQTVLRPDFEITDYEKSRREMEPNKEETEEGSVQ